MHQFTQLFDDSVKVRDYPFAEVVFWPPSGLEGLDRLQCNGLVLLLLVVQTLKQFW